jgi:hypothetical protein
MFVTAETDQLLRNCLSDIQQLVPKHLVFSNKKKERKKRHTLGNLFTLPKCFVQDNSQ